MLVFRFIALYALGMARPDNDEPKNKPVMALLTDSDLAALDDWRFARRIGSRSEAIRQLIARGLEADAKPPEPERKRK